MAFLSVVTFLEDGHSYKQTDTMRSESTLCLRSKLQRNGPRNRLLVYWSLTDTAICAAETHLSSCGFMSKAIHKKVLTLNQEMRLRSNLSTLRLLISVGNLVHVIAKCYKTHQTTCVNVITMRDMVIKQQLSLTRRL